MVAQNGGSEAQPIRVEIDGAQAFTAKLPPKSMNTFVVPTTAVPISNTDPKP